MEKVCPRCKLPQEGINECEYCGLVFAQYTKETKKEQRIGPDETQKVSQQSKAHSTSAIEPKPSPFWPQHLVDLFISPRKFFSGQLSLGKTPYVILVTWCYGISHTIDRINRELFRVELGNPRSSWEQFGPMITESWFGFWKWVLMSGAIGGIFIWWIGGWWYRIRLKWSGDNEPDKRASRLVFVYSSFVMSGPTVAFALAYTVAYSNYLQAYSSNDFFSLLLPVFLFWSIITSYIGARTVFNVSQWKALIWFAILPCLFYIILLGLTTMLLAFLGG